MAARMSSLYDLDGSLMADGELAIYGSHRNWWHVDSGCTYIPAWNLWRQTWASLNAMKKEIAYMDLYVKGIYDGCTNDSPLSNNLKSSCTMQKSNYTVGYVAQFGFEYPERAIEMAPWKGVTGPADIGWYWRTPWGAPNEWRVGPFMALPRGRFVVIAMKYPHDSVFNVRVQSNWYGTDLYDSLSMANELHLVLNVTEGIENDPNDMVCWSSGNWYNFCNIIYYLDSKTYFLNLIKTRIKKINGDFDFNFDL